MQYFIWCIGCAQNFNLTILLEPVPLPTHNKMLGGSEEKIIYHTSARVHVIILITWILTDIRRSKNIQKKINYEDLSRISFVLFLDPWRL